MLKALTNVTEKYQTFVSGMALWAGGTNNGPQRETIHPDRVLHIIDPP